MLLGRPVLVLELAPEYELVPPYGVEHCARLEVRNVLACQPKLAQEPGVLLAKVAQDEGIQKVRDRGWVAGRGRVGQSSVWALGAKHDARAAFSAPILSHGSASSLEN